VTVRRAVPDDARGIAEVQVGTWRVAYTGLVADDVLDSLSVDERARQFRAWLGGTWSARHFVADEDGIVGFATIVNAGALSWTADGKHLAFVGPGRSAQGPSAVRLLDVTVPGSDLAANSRPIATPPPGDKADELSWRAAIVTPDGQAAVIVEEVATDGAPIRVRDRLLKVSAATGRVTVLNDLNVLAGYQYEQIMYASPDGSTLVVSGARRGYTAGILRGDSYTPLPWSRDIAIAAW
jgi:hypothetical protein